MSYSIYYGPEQYKPVNSGWVGKIGAAIIVTVCALAVGFGIPKLSTELRHRLFPWTQPVVQQAFSVFCDDIEDGERFSDAIADFCVEVLQNADKN